MTEPLVKTYSGGKPNYTEPIEPEPMIDGWPLYSGLPQPKPEPVAFLSKDRKNYVVVGQPRWDVGIQHWTPLYTAPPQREWVGLTSDEISCIIEASEITLKNYCSEDKQTEYAHAIEAKLREKNG